jgi:energy-coupling factor transport system permease protein
MDILRSLPFGLYLEQPITWLHRIDPRLKLLWLLTLLVSLIQANLMWRWVVVAILITATISTKIPPRAWGQQMGWLLLLAGMTMLIGVSFPDGTNITYELRRPLPEIALPQPTDYQYVLFRGIVTITRRSLDIAQRASSLIFTSFYAPTLFLLVTSPEEVVLALTSLTAPLKRLGVPIVEVMLTLTLALRFVPLVLEEIQNLVRAVRTRAIVWKRLGLRRSMQIGLVILERLLKNLFLRAEQTALAMQARGFTTPNTHQVKWRSLRLTPIDLVGTIALLSLISIRFTMGNS